MVAKILGLLFGVKDIKFRCDDDFVDRLNRRYTTTIMMLFALVVTAQQYVGSPIHCWCPAQFTGTMVAYTDTICWISNTYYVPMENQLPLPKEPRMMVSYYQWVPFILLAQALFFYVPSMFWRFISKRSGFNVAACLDAALAGQRTNYADIREKTTRYMVHQIDRYLAMRTGRRSQIGGRNDRGCFRACNEGMESLRGSYLTICYIFVKLLYLANAIIQLYVLDVFLGHNFHFYGIEVIHRLSSGEDWTTSYRFPRVTMCNFQIRHMNVLHDYIIQCALPINLFNEKIFIFVWFWLVFVALCTASSLIKWAWKSCAWPSQVQWVRRQLRPMNDMFRMHKDVVGRFTHSYLKRDGMFILRLVGNNVGNLVAAEVLAGLWSNYGPERKFTPTNEAPTLPQRGQDADDDTVDGTGPLNMLRNKLRRATDSQVDSV